MLACASRCHYRLPNNLSISNVKDIRRLHAYRQESQTKDKDYNSHKQIQLTRRKYREKNKEKLNEYDRSYYSQNAEKIKERKRLYQKHKRQQLKESKGEIKQEILDNTEQIRISLETALSIKDPTDWYRITQRGVCKHHRFTRYFAAVNLPNLLNMLYPSMKWEPGRFKYSPSSMWKNREITRTFLRSLEPKLFIKSQEDWYRVSAAQLERVGAGNLVNAFGRLHSALAFGFPEIPWDSTRFSYKGKKLLCRVVEEMYPEQEIEEEYFHPSFSWDTLVSDTTAGQKISFDVWVGQSKMAFEYQGEQHYHDQLFGSCLQDQAKRDEVKKNLCFKHSIRLVTVPYWWDDSASSLRALIELCE